MDKSFRSPCRNGNVVLVKNNESTPSRSKIENNKTQKRIFTPDKNQSLLLKKIKIDVENDTRKSENDPDKELFQSDLHALQLRIRKKQQEVDYLKKSLLYLKKHPPEELQTEIKTWRAACQSALRRYQENIQEQQGQPVSISEILAAFGISETVVQYSAEEDVFET